MKSKFKNKNLNFLQFLEEIDYSLAFKTLSDRATFKSISDKATVFSDAMDSYFNCIWDATLLEFIVNFLAKRGEHARKQLAVINFNNFSNIFSNEIMRLYYLMTPIFIFSIDCCFGTTRNKCQ